MAHGLDFEAKAKTEAGAVDDCSDPYSAEVTPIRPAFGPRIVESDQEDAAPHEIVVHFQPSNASVDASDCIETGPSGSPTFGESFEGEERSVKTQLGPDVLHMDTEGNLNDAWTGRRAISPSGLPPSPMSYCQGVSNTLSLNSMRSVENHQTNKSTEASLVSKESLVTLNNLKKSNISQHLELCKEIAFKQRIRTSGTLCGLGLLFVMAGVGVTVGTLQIAVPLSFGDILRAFSVAFLLFGLVSFLLALLPTDTRAVPVAAWILFAQFFLFGGVCINVGLMYVLEDDQALQAGSAALLYVKGSCIVFSGILFFILALYLLLEICRPRRNKRLLSRMWYVSSFFFAIVACLSALEAIIDCTQYGLTGLYWFIATIAATLCVLTARNKDFRNRIQTCTGTRGESAGSAAAIAALVGSNSVEEVLEMARCSFFTVKADRLKMEHMASSTPDPSLTLGKLARRSRLGEADAFISHSWTDDPLAKWNAIQGWRKRFKRQHQAEPKLWIDKYCIDQDDFQNSLACLPIYLASCSKMVVICGETYLTRLWCVVELFVFLEMGGSLENLEVIVLPDPEHRIADGILDFDPSNLQCSREETADMLQNVLEAGRGGLDGIRDLVRQRFAPKAVRRKVRPSKEAPRKLSPEKIPEKLPVSSTTEEMKYSGDSEEQCFSI